ncbi:MULTISPECIES: hypothetical protein [unclassified Serratia (in: enterobacteria)]|uniref:hypothetical protein n=1 Tax=unclassified Serratia (in: enterobacteria) TaxID=2647522 RepID=UPI0027EF57ED|nr:MULTISPECIES: hypothetical protein [unclassified Serratia (in: enterobacteria)]MDQ7101908.1 hypothetical protein [Serratia sp. MF2]MDQ7104484.1 hypothetical protein [Serratia sp. MF1(2023)]
MIELIKRPVITSIAAIPATYLCHTCKEEYQTEKEAIDCYNQTPINAPAYVGQIVREKYFRFGWFDGDPAWIADRRPAKSASGEEFRFWYVVTAVNLADARQCHYDMHRWLVSVNTLAVGQLHGWTSATHIQFETVSDDKIPQAVKDSALLVPKKMETSLL